jgi:L-proline amide hydrolase
MKLWEETPWIGLFDRASTPRLRCKALLWDIIPRLGEIRVPTLVTSGRYDEATPLIAGTVHDGIPGSQWVLFEESSHMPHVEEPEHYMQVLDEFLTEVEGQAG